MYLSHLFCLSGFPYLTLLGTSSVVVDDVVFNKPKPNRFMYRFNSVGTFLGWKSSRFNLQHPINGCHVHTYNPSTPEAENGDIQGQHWMHSRFEASLSYMRPWFRTPLLTTELCHWPVQFRGCDVYSQMCLNISPQYCPVVESGLERNSYNDIGYSSIGKVQVQKFVKKICSYILMW